MREKDTNTPDQSPFKIGPADKPVIRLTGATLRIRDRFLLPDTSWQIDQGQHWAVLGPNGAGKTTLVRALTGEVPVVRGAISHSRTLTAGYVSFEHHQEHIYRGKMPLPPTKKAMGTYKSQSFFEPRAVLSR